MIECAVRIPATDWRAWLAAVGDARTIRAVELPGDLLEPGDPGPLKQLEHLGLSLLHVPDLLPVTFGRFAADTCWPPGQESFEALSLWLRERFLWKIRLTSVDLALDRVRTANTEDDLRIRVELLRILAREAYETDVGVALRLRVPDPFPSSRQWEYAANILYELGGDACGLALDVVPEDLAPDFDIETCVRRCASRLRLLRFLYGQRPAEHLAMPIWRAWAKALRSHCRPVGVVLCPRHPILARADALLASVETLCAVFAD
ncbi:MAG: hypothetical protein JXR77_05400 [Lentisphaeria bacterium]|nr:hypothetical protein [Lentisphaeria bacterium]